MIFKVGDGERVVSVARLPDDADENGDGTAEDPSEDQPSAGDQPGTDIEQSNDGQETDTGDQ